MKRLDLCIHGKVAFVSGASKGIGRETAMVFAEEGADVVVAYGRDEAGARQTAEQVRALGRTAWLCPFEMANADSVTSAMAELSLQLQGSAIDMAVLNAGSNITKPFDEVTFEEWNDVVQTNLNGTFYVLKQIRPLLANPSSIVLVASVAAHTGVPQHPHYAASKAGLVNLTKSAARAWAPHIRVNCIAPGMTLTEMGAQSLTAQDENYAKTKLLSQRYASAREIAQNIVYVASPLTGFMYGSTVEINGGRDLR